MMRKSELTNNLMYFQKRLELQKKKYIMMICLKRLIGTDYCKVLAEDMDVSEESCLKQWIKFCLFRNTKYITRREKLTMITNHINHPKIIKDHLRKFQNIISFFKVISWKTKPCQRITILGIIYQEWAVRNWQSPR